MFLKDHFKLGYDLYVELAPKAEARNKVISLMNSLVKVSSVSSKYSRALGAGKKESAEPDGSADASADAHEVLHSQSTVVSCLRVPYCVVRPAWPVLEEFARLQMITRRALAQGLNVEIPRADLPALPALLRAPTASATSGSLQPRWSKSSSRSTSRNRFGRSLCKAHGAVWEALQLRCRLVHMQQ
jgi:hypothetical protein